MAIDFANVTTIGTVIAAAGGLGTAAYGLVDASKALGGGISNAGFRSIRRAVTKLLGRTGGPGMFGTVDALATLQANWINGVAKDTQKAIAKSLIRLSLTPAGAPGLAWALGLDQAELIAVATKIRVGTELSPQDVTILGQFDAVVSAVLDEAYERGDQQYRNWSKLSAAIVAILLAGIAGGLIYCTPSTPGGPHPDVTSYLGTPDFLAALLIGAISTPLAPIAKDLSSAISAAASAVSAWKA